MNTQPIRALTLDLDDTLWPIAPAIARAEEALFVGDDLDNDVRAPKALGLRTAWFTTEPTARPPEANIKVSDLRQLTSWCDLSSGVLRERVSGDRA